MRLRGSKILAAVAMPFAVAATFGGVLVSTHHTTFPPLEPPVGYLSASAPVQNAAACMKAERRFSGIAVDKLQVSPGQLQPSVVTSYQHVTKSPIKILEIYNSFPGTFDTGGASRAINLGALPLIQLNPGKLSKTRIEKIANGKYDNSIKEYADQVKDFKQCLVISFGHEMNGWWYDWGLPWNTPATFKKAWRHVHAIFAQEGAKNVIWSWDPSHQYYAVGVGKVATPASKWYPGPQYVDWIGLDGYLGADKGGRPQSFNQIFGFQLNNIRKFAPHKTVYLAETGVAPGPHAVSQIAELFAGVASSRLAGLVWFDASAKNDYRLGIYRADDAAYNDGLTSFLAKS